MPTPSRRFATHRAMGALFVLVVAAASCATLSPAHRSADLGLRKYHQGPVPLALTSDVVVLRDDAGPAPVVAMRESRHFSDGVLGVATSSLKGRGYPIGPSCIASIGQVLDPHQPYEVRGPRDQAMLGDTALSTRPPFLLDESLGGKDGRSESAARWASLVRTLWTEPPKRHGATTTTVPEAVELRGPLGGDVVCVITGLGWSAAPHGRRSAMVRAETGYAAWQHSATVLQLSVLDTRTGALLWSDGRRSNRPIDDRLVDTMVASMVRAMP